MRRIETGLARGLGMQDIGAYVNLAAYYLCGIPTAIILAFRFKMGGTGLWIGITAGSFVQSVLFGLIPCSKTRPPSRLGGRLSVTRHFSAPIYAKSV
ncbi:BnaCnng68290D [Brassica napus]|uniref:(rape) hypothetical protein n=1 Tax=Brassica napus TaxID=3708 RepID=A0A078JVF3_BRANA|nr:unnamed protein product [Brassica napus]CDY70425.1 BnaCnng68290D [Brassica napus]